MKRIRFIAATLAAGSLIISACTAASPSPSADEPGASVPEPSESEPAPSEAPFYEGKTIHLGVGFTAGGGFDIQARALAPLLEKYIPGNPTVLVENRDGAGSLVMANEMVNSDPQDGTYIGMVAETLVFAALVGQEGVEFDPNEMHWLAAPEINTNVCVARADSGIESLEELIETGYPLTVGTTGTSSSGYLYPTLINAALGTQIEVIAGYPGSAEVRLALEQGEIEGYCSGWVDTIRVYPQYFSEIGGNGDWIPLVQSGLAPDPNIPPEFDIPWVYDFLPGSDEEAMFQTLAGPAAMSRPFFAPPGVPDDLVQILREAFAQALADPEFVALAEETPSMNVSPKTGEEVQQIVADVMSTDQAIVDQVKEALGIE